jgi:hypothetical protein
MASAALHVPDAATRAAAVSVGFVSCPYASCHCRGWQHGSSHGPTSHPSVGAPAALQTCCCCACGPGALPAGGWLEAGSLLVRLLFLLSLLCVDWCHHRHRCCRPCWSCVITAGCLLLLRHQHRDPVALLLVIVHCCCDTVRCSPARVSCRSEHRYASAHLLRQQQQRVVPTVFLRQQRLNPREEKTLQEKFTRVRTADLQFMEWAQRVSTNPQGPSLLFTLGVSGHIGMFAVVEAAGSTAHVPNAATATELGVAAAAAGPGSPCAA